MSISFSKSCNGYLYNWDSSSYVKCYISECMAYRDNSYDLNCSGSFIHGFVGKNYIDNSFIDESSTCSRVYGVSLVNNCVCGHCDELTCSGIYNCICFDCVHCRDGIDFSTSNFDTFSWGLTDLFNDSIYAFHFDTDDIHGTGLVDLSIIQEVGNMGGNSIEC